MKEAIGGSWLLTIVVVFVVVFACYMSVSINYSKSYKVKDQILFYIEQYGGVNDSSTTAIKNYLGEVGYRTTGKCPSDNDWIGFNFNAGIGSPNSFCIQKHCVYRAAIGHPKTAYYSVKVFFKMDMPVIGDVVKFTLDGETSFVVIPNEKKELLKNPTC